MNNALGPLMLDLESTVLSISEKTLLQRPVVGGLILFSRNYESPAQLLELTAAIRSVRPELLIAVDQEGGRVQRLKAGFLALPALRLIGELYERSPKQGLKMAHVCGWAMAAEVVHHGIDFSFAPVLDLFTLQSEVIKERAFAADFESVSILAQAYVEGMNEAGMAATGKHFPGHGTVIADSHHELPIDSRAAEKILQSDYQAFARSIGFLGAIMPAHVQYPDLDENCAGYSSFWIKQKLRGELGFDGVVFSDDLTMTAAHRAGSLCVRADLALAAGCDMVLVCNDATAAEEVADYLEASASRGNLELSERLKSMSAQKKDLGDLYNSQHWLDASAAINKLMEGS
ncbi:MAG: beta-N-acetylhexosaminidase [Pseudohongiellaceae bacterium]|jgi:beta-N-acetylhexosaminidase